MLVIQVRLPLSVLLALLLGLLGRRGLRGLLGLQVIVEVPLLFVRLIVLPGALVVLVVSAPPPPAGICIDVDSVVKDQLRWYELSPDKLVEQCPGSLGLHITVLMNSNRHILQEKKPLTTDHPDPTSWTTTWRRGPPESARITRMSRPLNASAPGISPASCVF